MKVVIAKTVEMLDDSVQVQLKKEKS